MVLVAHHCVRFGPVTLTLLMLALGGCSAFPRQQQIHAHGEVAGHLVNTRVDSPLAEYYIEDYLAGNQSNPKLDEQLWQIQDHLRPGLPDDESLRWITKNYSRDMATIVLVERLAQDPVNEQFTAAYSRQLAMVKHGDVAPGKHASLKSGVVFLFVPGWYWRDESYDGALDVSRQYLDDYGYQTELLSTDDKASVEQNADMVAGRLRELQRAGKLVVLMTVSKGSAETAFALGQLLTWQESRHVLAWVNVNGGVRGSPMADELMGWRRNLTTRLLLLLAYRDHAAGLKSMRTRRRRSVFDSLALPPHVLIVNVTAVPFSGQVTRRSGGYNKLLDKYGPHDGTLMIRDQLIDNAPTVTELGFDHFFFDSMIGVKTVALVRVLEESLGDVSTEPVVRPLPSPAVSFERDVP